MIGRGTTVVENVVGGVVGFVLMCYTEGENAYRRYKKRREQEKALTDLVLRVAGVHASIIKGINQQEEKS